MIESLFVWSTIVIKVLQDWGYGAYGEADGYQSPELMPHGFGGKMDGKEVVIPQELLIAYDPMTEVFKGSDDVFYRLGIPSDSYEKSFPDARDRILSRMKAKLPYFVYAS